MFTELVIWLISPQNPRAADKRKPYRLPIFCDVIRPCLEADGGSYLKAVRERFKGPDGVHYEMPRVLLALASTFVSALFESMLRFPSDLTTSQGICCFRLHSERAETWLEDAVPVQQLL